MNCHVVYEKNPGYELSMINFLCMQSILANSGVAQLHIHTNDELNSHIYELKSLYGDRVVTRTLDLSGVPNHIEKLHHKYDYYRLKTLYEEGGMISDIDNFFVSNLVRHFHLSMPLLFTETWDKEKFKGYSIGCVLARRNSAFVKTWLSHYDTDYKNDSWSYNSIQVPGNLGMSHRALSEVCYPPHYLDEKDESIFANFDKYISDDALIYSFSGSMNPEKIASEELILKLKNLIKC